jgi:hypothetical protein
MHPSGTNRRGLPVLALLALAAAACTPTVLVTRMRPSELPTRAGMHVAVQRFDGNDGANLGGEIAQAISTGRYFELVDRDATGRIADEQRMIVEGLAGNSDGIRVGALEAAALFISGDAHSDYDEDMQSLRTSCSRYQNGKSYSYPCTRHTRLGRVRYTANLKVVDTSSGKSTARTLTSERTDTETATDNTPARIDSDALVAGARSEVASEFMQLIVPTPVQETVELVKDGDLPQLADGNNFAKADNWAAATRRYSEAVARSNAGLGGKAFDADVRAKAAYALGVALVIQGQFQEGIAQLSTAADLSAEERYGAMLARARDWEAEAKRLDDQGATPGAGPAKLKLNGPRLRTR